MRITRRGALGAAVASLAWAQRSPETPEGYAAWNAFAKEWNHFADLLNNGIFDQRLWKRVCKAFRSLEEQHPH